MTLPRRNYFHQVSTWISMQTVHLSSCSVQSQFQAKRKTHQYQERWQFKDVPSMSKYLLDQVFYHKDGVVVLNKPANLGSSRNDCSIYHSLPYLSKELGYKKLELVFVPEKSISGITILSENTSLAAKVNKALRRSKSLYSVDPRQKFLAVTVGHPILEDSTDHYGVTAQFKEKQKHYLLLREWSTNSVKRREVNPGYIAHKILAKSDFASLVSVSTWQYKKHCPRIFLSDILLSPALGDQEFGRRVGSLFNKTILMKPWQAPAVKALPLPLLQKLSLTSGSEGLIPQHLHLHELALHSFLQPGRDLILQAEPPDYFKWTCQQLNLSLKPSVNDQSVDTQQSEVASDQCGEESEAKLQTDLRVKP